MLLVDTTTRWCLSNSVMSFLSFHIFYQYSIKRGHKDRQGTWRTDNRKVSTSIFFCHNLLYKKFCYTVKKDEKSNLIEFLYLKKEKRNGGAPGTSHIKKRRKQTSYALQSNSSI